MPVDRRNFLAACAALGLSGTLFPGALYAQIDDEGDITTEPHYFAANPRFS